MTQRLTYLVRDSAGNTYGPAAEGLIREWIGERRITAEMTVAAAGDAAFVPIADHPLFAATFAALPALAAAMQALPAAPEIAPTCGYAITALFLALGGMLVCPVLPSAAALWYARRSLQRIDAANADGVMRLGGRGLAWVAMVLALVGLLGGAGCLTAFGLAIFS